MDSESPQVIDITAAVRCVCGEISEFDRDDLLDGWQTVINCDGCERRIAVDASIYAQYSPEVQR